MNGQEIGTEALTDALAEAQRRLAAWEWRGRVEDALERVREKTLVMRGERDELAGAAAVIFREIKGLGLAPWRCAVAIWDADEQTLEIWFSTNDGRIIPRSTVMPIEVHPSIQAGFDAWARREPVYTYAYEGQDLLDYATYLFTHTTLSLPEWREGSPADFPTRMLFNMIFFSQGFLLVQTAGPYETEEMEVIQRFARVFDLAYRRYLDLKHAEARARDASRQASLDRLRAEIASMRATGDLQRFTPLVWRELTALGVPFTRCGVFIVDEPEGLVHVLLSNPKGEPLAALSLPVESRPFLREAVARWRSRKVHVEHWDRQAFQSWMAFLREQSAISSDGAYLEGSQAPESLALHIVPFEQGMLYVGNTEPLSKDELDLVQDLADAFAVAYARYCDFVCLEAQNRELEAAKSHVEEALLGLRTTQQQLVHAEKMASLGALTAGIAHAIKNPLNFVNNFASISTELFEEIREALSVSPDLRVAEIEELLSDLERNALHIAKHGRRADGIVRSMLEHSRGTKGERQPTEVNALVDEYLSLAYHGMRAQRPGFTVALDRDFDPSAGRARMVPQEVGRVLLNLLNNAFHAVHEQAAALNGHFTPAVSVATRRTDGLVEIRVQDNGPGIPEAIREKIFEPFFTTRPTGQGTGLGLSLAYDIVAQGHGGTLSVTSAEGQGATFVVTLPA